MELRRTFTNADLTYLANLCHNCSGCYYACQYAPPHEFALNIPQTFAQVRNESYAFYAWPKPLARLFERNGVVLGIVVAFSVAFVILLTSSWRSHYILYERHTGPGSFYQIISILTMTSVAMLAFGFSMLVMSIGFIRFWRDTGGKPEEHVTPEPLFQAASDILTLKNLGGGGEGCNDQNQSLSTMRRNYHHFLFYGFTLCTASTIVAGIYEHFFTGRRHTRSLVSPSSSGRREVSG
jgi:citrate/tricarballylate utilization protein